MKFFYLIISITLLLAGSPLSAGTVTGTVENGTEGYSIPDDLTIILNRYVNGRQDDKFVRSADLNRQNSFRFTDLPEESGVSYEPMAEYQGVRYYGKAAVLSEKNSIVTSDVQLFESSRSDSALSVKMHHFIIEPAEGFVRVREMMAVTNSGDRTYVGSQPTSSGKFRTVSYALPEGASQLQLAEGLMSCCVEFEAGGFYDTMEFMPGTKQIVFAYRIDAPKKNLSVTKAVTLPTGELDVMATDRSLQINSANLTEKAVQGMPVQRLVAQNLNSNEQVKINLAGLPGSPMNLGSIAFWTFLIMLFFFGLFVFTKLKRSGSEAGIENEEIKPVTDRERVLGQIAELDERFEAGKLEESEYKKQRAQLKRVLGTLIE